MANAYNSQLQIDAMTKLLNAYKSAKPVDREEISKKIQSNLSKLDKSKQLDFY